MRLRTQTMADRRACGARLGTMIALVLLSVARPAPAATSSVDVSRQVLPKIVKIYGAGGIRGLEAYQSGILISGTGHILTAWSYVLDTDSVLAVLHDGRRFPATLVGADPRSELAVLKIEAADLPYFDLEQTVELQVGDRVLAYSNLYGIAAGDEPASVLHGHVAAVTRLSARRGVYQTSYDGPVYALDAMTNNAGAAGGALTDDQGRLAGVLGKELRNSQNNIWLNYALPMSEVRSVITDLLQGKTRRQEDSRQRKPEQPVTLTLLGLVLIPDVLPKTPPFVERVHPDSPAAKAGVQADDLIVFVQTNMVSSCQEFVDELSYIDRLQTVRITVMRKQTLLPLELTVERPSKRPE